MATTKKIAIASLIGVIIAVLIPLGAVFFFKIKENDRRTVEFPRSYFATGMDTAKDEFGKVKLDKKGMVVMDTTYHVVPKFTLTSQDGQSFNSESLKGRLYVAEFFFASCPGICPIMNSNMQKIQQEFIGDDQVKIVSFSIDPDRDSVAALKKYADKMKAVSGKWYFLTGDKQQIFDLGKFGYKLTTQQGDGGSKDFEHSDKMILVDGDGHIRGYYNGTDSASVRDLMGDMVLILSRMRK